MITYILILICTILVNCQESLNDLYTLPILFNTFEQIITEPNKLIFLKCEASGVPMPRIAWKLDGKSIESPSEVEEARDTELPFQVSEFVVGSSNYNGISARKVVGYLNISSISLQEGGLYECSARNKFASSSHTARVHVKGDPLIKPMSDLIAVSGQKLTVNCPYSGYPIESIVWSKGPSKLPINRRQEVFSNGSLIIYHVQKSLDDGVYTCMATNGRKTATENVKISVIVGPMIDPFKFPESIQEGMRARLVCTVIQGDPPFVFQWLKNHELIDSPVNNIAIRTDEFSSDLTFNRVSTRHNGNYTCVVSNSVASDSCSAHLNVDVPPFWKVEPIDSSVVSGQNVLIDCLAEGYPQPSITWERGSALSPRSFTPVSSGPQYEVLANGSLFIKSAEIEDAGLYLCQASNSIGPELSKVVTLTVHAPPTFLTKFRSETVRLSDDTELRCDANGDSPMKIHWLVDKEPIESGERFFIRNETWPNRMVSILRIVAARRRDSALFTCLVSNAYGKDETNIRLIVQEPPESPRDLKVAGNRGREAKLTWSQSFNGNSEINRFWITCHPKDYSSPEFSSYGHLNMSVDNLTVEEKQAGVIRDLRPATSYLCTVKAENDVGLSKSSNSVEFRTDEQAPEGPPLNLMATPIDSRSITVKWNPPERRLWNGKLKGYYIGYKITATDDQYLYKTLEMSDEDDQYSQNNQVQLTSLKPFTTYDIIVQVYNSMGTGPRSDPISVTTLEDVPSKEPDAVSCSTLSSRSISVTWEPPPSSTINGLLKGYKVIYRPLGGDIRRLKKESSTSTDITLQELIKYTNYSIEVVALTRKGEGVGSKPIYCRTADDTPGPPFAVKVIIASADSAIVTWKDPLQRNGLITKYAVYWRELNNNRTRSSITVPKSRANVLTSRYRWPEPSPQYKITSLRKLVAYEVWVSAFTRKGEGTPTTPVTGIPMNNAPARILEWNETFAINGAEATPFVLGCHCVGSEPIQRTWSRDQAENLNIEVDGSLLIQVLPEESSNFTCQVSNEFGSDQVTYHLDRVLATDKTLKVRVLSTSHTSAQILFARDPLSSEPSSGHLRDYEINYRVVGWNSHDWQIKPIFRVLDGNHSFVIDNLLCGTLYKLYITDLFTGSKSDTITFATQGSAPVAPKKEDIIKIINNSTLYIYPSAWDQSHGCPIIKMIIEYRSSSHHTWKMVSTPSFPHENDPIPIKNLTPKSLYSVRITAYTKGSPSTMAEYDIHLGYDEQELYSISSGAQRGLTLDTTTIISFLSSLIVLIAGCFIIVCLVVYKRHTTVAGKPRSNHYRRQSSLSCAASSNEGEGMEKRGACSGGGHLDIGNSEMMKKNQSLSSTQSSNNDQSSIIKKAPTLKVLRGTKIDRIESKIQSAYVPSESPVKGRLPAVRIPTKQLAEIEKEIQNDYDEITPYATFPLTNDDEATTEEEFKTFSVRIGEPGYVFKTAVDAAPTTSRDYKSATDVHSKTRDTYLFGVINSQSLTSGSSNQEELVHAYEYGRRYHLQNPVPAYYDEDDIEYGKSQTSEMDTPTDPGIRQFTKSPPRPNEQRQAACFTPGLNNPEHNSSEQSETSSSNSSDSYSSSADSSCVTPINAAKGVPIKEGRKASFTLLTPTSRPENADSMHPSASEERTCFKIGLSSDDEDHLARKNASKSKLFQANAPVPPRHRSSGRHHPRNRNKRPPYRTKSRSDEIEC